MSENLWVSDFSLNAKYDNTPNDDKVRELEDEKRPFRHKVRRPKCYLIYFSELTISQIVLPMVLISPVTKALPAMK